MTADDCIAPPIPGDLAARLAANPAYQSALLDAESESWDGPGVEASAVIEAASERLRATGAARSEPEGLTP